MTWDSPSILAGLNPEQRKAVETLEGPVLLLAGAGTGKTRVIICRIANLIRHGVPPGQILAVTFTNKAAKEMRSRVAELIEPSLAEKLTVSTFHSFCLQILRHQIHKLGYSRNFSIAAEGYQKGLVREVATELGVTGTGFNADEWLSAISRAKAALESPSDVMAKGYPLSDKIGRVFARYQERMRQMNLVDFDDLLGLTVRLWEEHPEALEFSRGVYHYLMIDEYQDTNSVQLHLMRLLAGSRGNICAVGDDDQSIYGWRGANLDNILDFETYFPHAAVLRLEHNYRSTNTILNAANELIAHNRSRHDKHLWSQQGEGEKILMVRCADERDEAEFIANYLLDRVTDGQWKRHAVLFRAGHQARVLEETFRRKRVPHILVGANSFYERREILDALGFLQLVANPKNDMALLRVLNVPPRGIGDGTQEKLVEQGRIIGQPLFQVISDEDWLKTLPGAAAEGLRQFRIALNHGAERFATLGDLCKKAEALYTDLDYLDGLGRMYKPREDALQRKENVLEFLGSLDEFDEKRGHQATLGEFLEQMALEDARDRQDRRRNDSDNSVTLMTVHASKGLEFPVVFVAGMEQKLFPHQMALDEGNEEEERRLCYVAFTRAKEQLILTYADKRRVQNETVRRLPSRFLNEFSEELAVLSTPAKVLKPASLNDIRGFLDSMRAQFRPPS